MTRFDETWHRLLDWTQGQAPSERLAALLLNEEGYDVIDPSHPLGGKDEGADADATCSKTDNRGNSFVVEPSSLRWFDESETAVGPSRGAGGGQTSRSDACQTDRKH